MNLSKSLLSIVALMMMSQSAFAVPLTQCGDAGPSNDPYRKSAAFLVSAGDVVAATSTTGFGAQSEYNDGLASAIITGNNFTYVVPEGVTQVYVNVNGWTSELPGTVTLTCSLASQGGGAIGQSASSISANSQTHAMQTGTSNNSRSRLGGTSSTVVSRSQLFLSTQNLSSNPIERPELNLWISAEGRHYSGGYDGYSADVVVGADKLFSDNFLAGLMLAYGRVDITDATDSAVANSPAVGAYFATKFAGDLILDGYVSYARPEYNLNGAAFKSDRVSVSLSLSGEHRTGTLNIRPFASVNGYSESQPSYTGTGGAVAANDIKEYKASLGARFEMSSALGSMGMTPYVSAAVEYAHSKSTAKGITNFTAPRLGFGMSGPVGEGYLSIDLDGGKVTSNTYDVGVRATYEFKF